MQEIDVLERDWRDTGLDSPFHRAMTFTEAGLALGRGTLLAFFTKDALAKRERVVGSLFHEGYEARILSLLMVAYGRPIDERVIEKISRAGEFWCAGHKTLSKLHLALVGLPVIDDAGAYRLFLAGKALDKGASPSNLMKASGFSQAALELQKYWEDQPRVPAGSGRESGRWTSGDGARRQYAQASDSPASIQRLHPDETYETDQKAKRSLEYWRQRSNEEIIQSLEPSPGNQEALTVKPDGTVVQGNTRIKVLEERGFDVNSLPRVPFDEGIEMFLPQLRTPGGGGSAKDKKYPIQE